MNSAHEQGDTCDETCHDPCQVHQPTSLPGHLPGDPYEYDPERQQQPDGFVVHTERVNPAEEWGVEWRPIL